MREGGQPACGATGAVAAKSRLLCARAYLSLAADYLPISGRLKCPMLSGAGAGIGTGSGDYAMGEFCSMLALTPRGPQARNSPVCRASMTAFGV